jgi:hypothetical protein
MTITVLKRVVVKNDVSIHISTSSSFGDMERNNHSWDSTSLLVILLSLCTLPHLKLDNGSNTIGKAPPYNALKISLG